MNPTQMNLNEKTTLLTARPVGFGTYVRQLWQYRRLIFLLARRDLKAKYAQSMLGVLWALIQPLTGLLIFSFFFDRLIHLRTEQPYSVFAFTGIVCWQFFSNIVGTAGVSLMESQHLIKKVYFPKLSLLLAKVLAGMTELVISLGLLLGMLVVMGISPGFRAIFFPLVIAGIVAVGLSVAVWLSALTVRYRDFYHIIPYLTNYGIWLTPVFFPDTLLPERYAWIMHFNPMAACIAAMRWSLIGGPAPDLGYLMSLAPVVILLVTGLWYFRSIENEISDHI